MSFVFFIYCRTARMAKKDDRSVFNCRKIERKKQVLEDKEL